MRPFAIELQFFEIRVPPTAKTFSLRSGVLGYCVIHNLPTYILWKQEPMKPYLLLGPVRLVTQVRRA